MNPVAYHSPTIIFSIIFFDSYLDSQTISESSITLKSSTVGHDSDGTGHVCYAAILLLLCYY